MYSEVEKLRRIRAHTQYKLASGEIVPGVTTVLGVLAKPALIKWANNLGLQGIDSEKYVDVTAQIGTLAHYLIECQLKGEKPDLEPFSGEQITAAQYALSKWNAWRKEHAPKIIASEISLVSEAHRYGGTIDIIAKLRGKTTLIDLKTAKDIYLEHAHQVGAYWNLARENGYRVLRGMILRIGRTPEEGYEEKYLMPLELKKHWAVFKHCLAIYQLRRELT